MTGRVRRLGPSIEATAYRIAERAFEAHWWAVFERDHLDPALAVIVDVWERSIDRIVRDALARHGFARTPCRRVVRLRPRAHHRRQPRCSARVAGKAVTTGDPDDEYPRQVWPKGGAR